MPWEEYLARHLPAGDRLPRNFKTFDFFSEETGMATSAKTLDTGTAARLAKSKQVYDSIRRNIDAATGFDYYRLSGVELSSDMIVARQLQLAVPSRTRAKQWVEIMRAVEYGKQHGVNVVVTKVR
jgi:filamentous hemagglutinin